jgi:excinuclease UvrABC helicase subunit UvrB
MQDFKEMFDVLIGVNLLREGLDLPEVFVQNLGCRQRGILPIVR